MKNFIKWLCLAILLLSHPSVTSAPIPDPVPETNTIVDSASSSRDDLRATGLADVFVMANDGVRDLVRGLDMDYDKIDVSAFASDFDDLTITNVLRGNGSVSWINVADAEGDPEILVRFDSDTPLDAANLTEDAFLF